MDEPIRTAAVATLLIKLVQDDEELRGLVTVVTGPQAAVDRAPEAQRLQTVGVSWDWVALQFDHHRFWDLHVGVLPAPAPAPAGLHVGLHWSRSCDRGVRPWAQSMLPEAELSFSVAAQEHQLTLAHGDGRSVFADRPAAEAATRLAALFAMTAIPLSSDPPNARPRS